MATLNKLSKFNRLDTLHKDLIHDISFNYYGSMLATCSSDQTIKIWKCIENDEWELSQIINHIGHTHKASIQMITWANPIFGSIFATCSTDKKINIFQLCECEQQQSHSHNKYSNINHNNKTEQKFLFQRVFLEFHDAISISFLPSHLGLKLSIVCNDGIIKILQARDITNLTQWNQEYSININESSLIKTKPFSMAWNQSKWEIPSFVVGANRNRLFIYKYFDNKDNQIQAHQKQNSNLKSDWHCISKIEIPKKVSKVNVNGKANNKNKQYFDIRGISWSNHLGRKYHLIAIGCSDGYVRIIKLIRNNKDMFNLKWQLIFQSSIHKDSVWKVKWNLTGNILISAGDDAKIYLWKRNRLNVDQQYTPMCISNGQNDKAISNDEEKINDD